jgi:hypothetical protein
MSCFTLRCDGVGRKRPARFSLTPHAPGPHQALAQRADFDALVDEKRRRLTPDELAKMEACRKRELVIMRENFRDSVYHKARKSFVYKESPVDTPQHLVRAGARSLLRRC